MRLNPVVVTLLASCLLFTTVPLAEAQQREAESASAAEPAAVAPVAKQPRKPLPKDLAGLQQYAVEAYEQGQYLPFVQATMKLRELRPYEPQYLVGMVVGAALVGRPKTAYSYMHIMQQQGLSYDFNSTPDTESIRATEVYGYINDLLVRAGQPSGEASTAFTLEESPGYPEAIAWDESRGAFLVGTIDRGAVLAVSPEGKAQELLRANDDNGLWAIHGLAVDKARGRLWVASSGVPGFAGVLPTDVGRSALFEFDLGSLELLQRHFVPVDGLPHLLGRPVVAADGNVYVIDRAWPMVLRKAAGADGLEVFVANPQLTGFRDVAISDDGRIVYVADAALGIAAFDTGEQMSRMLAAPETLNLGGISGLLYHAGHLLVVQNGIVPQRVMRLQLDPSGFAVVDSRALASAHEAFNFPSFGTLRGAEVFYFASGNTPGANAGPVKALVMKSPVFPAGTEVPVANQKFTEDTFGAEQEE